MLNTAKRDKFFEVLRNIFVGAKIEGASGYVNLMRIKSKYYNEFKRQLLDDINEQLHNVGAQFEEELYNKLYTFFKKYFSESGSIYFSYTPLQEKIYERVYRNDRDVALFWKTNMLYYVKTERLYNSMEVELNDYRYYFDVSLLEHKKSNEKKELIFELDRWQYEDKGRELFFFVKYSSGGTKTKTDEIVAKVKKQSGFWDFTSKHLDDALAVFRRQSEVDYFINKDARSFLREQFSLWIKGYLLDDETIFEEKRLRQLKALQQIAFQIIDLVSQFEDELVRIWNKPKFAHSSNYVITLDKIAAKDMNLVEQIIAHEGFAAQLEEWKSLGFIDEKFKPEQIIENTTVGKLLHTRWQFLPIDTKYFNTLIFNILALFDDLDNQLDGWLIHSENYQALNTIKKKFREKVQTIYIDPPYNTNASEIDYINNYRSSSWLSLIENRIELSKNFLHKKGILCVTIDDLEFPKLKILLQNHYENILGVIPIRNNPSGRSTGKGVSIAHEYAIFLGKSENSNVGRMERNQKQIERYDESDDNGAFEWVNFRKHGGLREEAEKMYYPIFIKVNDTFRIPNMEWSDSEKKWELQDVLQENEQILYPIDSNGKERRWKWGLDRLKKEKDEVIVKLDKDNNKGLYIKSRLQEEGILPLTWWEDKKYSSTAYGTNILKDLFGELASFIYPKSLYAVMDSLIVSSIGKNSLALDFFGGSGTTAHAIVELNRSDNGKRKYIIAEMGAHFDNVILPRMKKISFSDTWKNGKAQAGQGYSHFFKYYSLEQYEETLSRVKYEDKGALPIDNIYEQYLFLKDVKLADEVIAIDDAAERIKVNLEALHPAIDIAETLSHLTGKFIKQIKENEVIFTDDTRIALDNIDYKLIKPLIWW